MTATSKPPPPTLTLKPLLLLCRPPPPPPVAPSSSSAAAASNPGAAAAAATTSFIVVAPDASEGKEAAACPASPSSSSLSSSSPKSLFPSASDLRSSLRSLLGASQQHQDSPYASCSLLVPVEFEFSRTQERAFVELDSAMTRCAARYLLLALASAGAAAVGGSGGGPATHHHAPGLPCPHSWIARAEAAQALAVSVFLWAAGEPFARIAETRGNDLSHLMAGLSETAHALLEATIMSSGLCLLFAASAAALWPRGAFPAIAAMTFAATAARATLHRYERSTFFFFFSHDRRKDCSLFSRLSLFL